MSQEVIVATGSWKEKRLKSPLKPLLGISHCEQQVKLILDFWSLKLRRCTSVVLTNQAWGSLLHQP